MKVKYSFNNGETVEIEVDSYWGEIILQFDREERNNDHKETRGDRKYQTGSRLSLEAMNYEGESFADGTDILGDLIKKEESKALNKAISELLTQQQELLRRVFEDEEKVVDIAREQGVSITAIRDRLKKIYAKLRKNLS